MTADARVAGIELGGTKGIAVIARGATIVARHTVATTTPDATLGALVDAVAAWHAAEPVAAIGIASFGPVALDPADAAFGQIVATTKPGWSHVAVRERFAQFGVPLGFDTDVAGAALAEGRWGAAQGCSDHVYLTIGTGIGAGIVANGAPVHGRGHPEAGHIRVRRVAGDPFAGACPFHGDCLYGLASGMALAARTGIPGALIADDHPVWTNVAAELAELMATLIVTLAPQRIVVGGGVAAKRRFLLPAIRTRTATLLGAFLAGYAPPDLAAIIVPPALGDDAGPLGAAQLGNLALDGGA